MTLGPNPRATFTGLRFHHREPRFRVLFMELSDAFREKFHLSSNSSVLFLPGSGTFANEAVINSLYSAVSVHREKGEFASRLARLCSKYRRYDSSSPYRLAVHYETGESYFEPKLPDDVVFLDAVSSFPYYDVPERMPIWTTVSGKQLGGYPGVAIVVLNSRGRTFLHSASYEYSCLNLMRYEEYAAKSETPHTPALPILADLLQRIEKFNLAEHRLMIDDRRDRLMQVVPTTEVVGEGPVFSIRNSIPLNSVADKWHLYKGAGVRQVFLWSGTDSDYNLLIDDLQKAYRTWGK